MNPVVLLGLLGLLLAVGPVRAWVLTKLTREAPGGTVFTIANRRQFSDPLSLIGIGTPMGERAAVLTASPGVTADERGICIWDGTPFTLVGRIEWHRITSIEATDVATTVRRVSPAAIVLLVEVGDASIPLPLLSPNGTRSAFGSRKESRWLADRLEELRTAA